MGITRYTISSKESSFFFGHSRDHQSYLSLINEQKCHLICRQRQVANALETQNPSSYTYFSSELVAGTLFRQHVRGSGEHTGSVLCRCDWGAGRTEKNIVDSVEIDSRFFQHFSQCPRDATAVPKLNFLLQIKISKACQPSVESLMLYLVA